MFFGPELAPRNNLARGSTSAGRRFRLSPCESRTTTSVAPAANAPSIAAFVSPAMIAR